MRTQHELIISLLFECVCDGKTCPMHAAHQLPPRQRIPWAEKLTHDERREILNHYFEWISILDSMLSQPAALSRPNRLFAK